MPRIRPHVPWPLLVALVLVLHAVPATAFERPRPQSQGAHNVLTYSACAVSVAAAFTLTGLVGAFINCARVMLEEIRRPE
jgi:hypothetical protein